MLKPALRRLVHPKHLWRAFRLKRGARRIYRVEDDARLELMSKINPGGFLNYGYFEPPFPEPDEISLADIRRAQQRYAELIADEIVDGQAPVLDVGCGMGGLLRLLLSRGHDATGLTPDKAQVTFLEEHLPQVPLIHEKFESIDQQTYAKRFGTVITAESLQYLHLDEALPAMQAILAPGGTWIAYDYFRVAPDVPGSGHAWNEFPDQLAKAGFKIEKERDLTENAMPTLYFIHMWAARLGLPLLDLIQSDTRRKKPGLHYILEDSFAELQSYARQTVDRADPATFRDSRRYRLLVMRRS